MLSEGQLDVINNEQMTEVASKLENFRKQAIKSN
jgi:hypothetical protein